ncbi:MAG: CoA-binding protein [Candidatus Thermoplasmatota archaeon]|jgi:predicted CoA-binding protein|nr:CoA-binding protein [Candidatus Thermoplasmatota archaeon]
MIISNPADIKRILETQKNIAVVGMSPNPDRDSNKVGKYLMEKGYNVIPVNPQVPEIYGRKTYPSILDIPPSIKIDIVDVFRNPEAAKEVAVQASKIHPKVFWLQLGAESDDVIKETQKLGLDVIYGICIMETHKKMDIKVEFVLPN